jgi:hypothetical protein
MSARLMKPVPKGSKRSRACSVWGPSTNFFILIVSGKPSVRVRVRVRVRVGVRVRVRVRDGVRVGVRVGV